MVSLQLFVFWLQLFLIEVIRNGIGGIRFIIIILVFIITGGLSLFLGLLSLFLILFSLHLCLSVLDGSPGLLSDLLGLGSIIRDKEVVEDGARLNLPQIKTNVAHILTLVKVIVGGVVGVVNLGVNPGSFVGGVGDLFGLPFALVVGVIDERVLPFAVHLVIPIFGFDGVLVGNVFGLLPILGFDIGFIGDGLIIIPVFGFGCLGVLDGLGGEEVPVLIQTARFDLLVIDENLVFVVGREDEGVEMGEDVILAADILLDEVVLPLVAEDYVHFLGAGSADIGTEHDLVGRLSVHLSLVKVAAKHLQVPAAAVDVLLVLHGELDHEGRVLVRNGVELGRHSVETGVLGSLETQAGLLITVEFTSGQLQVTKFLASMFGLDPSLSPCLSIIKFVFEGNFGSCQCHQARNY